MLKIFRAARNRLRQRQLRRSLGYLLLSDSQIQKAQAYTDRQAYSSCGPAKVESAAERARRTIYGVADSPRSAGGARTKLHAVNHLPASPWRSRRSA